MPNHHRPLTPTTQSIFEQCPRFRILLVGKSGVGKTSLIKAIFKIDSIAPSHVVPGQADIEKEFIPKDNSRLVVHDSQGFEPGQVNNFDTVKSFIETRTSREEKIENRLHAIWFCPRTSYSDSRLLDKGDEEFFKLDLKGVPIIFVFTQCDNLYTKYKEEYLDEIDAEEYIETQHKEAIEVKVNKHFHDTCEIPLRRQLEQTPSKPNLKIVKVSSEPGYEDTLLELVQMTENMVRNRFQESEFLATVAAQRVDVDSKIEGSVTIGKKNYWSSIFSGVPFLSRPLHSCLEVLHHDIAALWDFKDPQKILFSPEIRMQIIFLIQDLALVPEEPIKQPTFGQVASLFQNVTGANFSDLKLLIFETAVPGLGLSLTVARWLYGIYANKPKTIQTVMGYIVDLVLIFEELFWRKVADKSHQNVNEEDINDVFDFYNASDRQRSIHRQIRDFVSGMSVLDQVGNDEKICTEIERLIKTNRRSFGHGRDSPQAV